MVNNENSNCDLSHLVVQTGKTWLKSAATVGLFYLTVTYANDVSEYLTTQNLTFSFNSFLKTSLMIPAIIGTFTTVGFGYYAMKSSTNDCYSQIEKETKL